MAVCAYSAGIDMTQDEIIKMARQAGFDFNQMSNSLYTVRGNYAQLEAFAKLVADKAFQNGYEKGIAGFNEAVSLEREACANLAATPVGTIAAAIRARGEA